MPKLLSRNAQEHSQVNPAEMTNKRSGINLEAINTSFLFFNGDLLVSLFLSFILSFYFVVERINL